MNHSVENFTSERSAIAAVAGVFSLGVASLVLANGLDSLVLLGIPTLLVVVVLLLIGLGVLDVPRNGPCGES